MLYGLEIDAQALAAGALQHVLLLQEKASRWQEALQAFVQAGMEAGATVVCVGGAPALEELCRELAARGLDLERRQQAGGLRLLPAGPWTPAAAEGGPASLRALLAGMERGQGDLRRAAPVVVLDVASLLGPEADLAAAAALGEEVEQMLHRGELRGCLCLYD
ncbi:MAG: MEDS domain-containing protein, partial [Syntrophomonadaceae bacterium]|nr:MEDS domain-containing protein [Syntrophomonadaceae bacterium]